MSMLEVSNSDFFTY